MCILMYSTYTYSLLRLKNIRVELRPSTLLGNFSLVLSTGMKTRQIIKMGN